MPQQCANCGTMLTENDLFCGGCGRSSVPSGMTSPGAGMVPEPRLPASSAPQWPDAQASVLSEAQLDAALGQATPNATYVGLRLLYDKVPESRFDPIDNTRILLQMLRQWFLYVCIYLVGAVLAGIVFGILAVGLGAVAFVLWWVCGAIAGLVLACCFWLLPLPALLSEWKISLDGKAAAATTAFEHIAWVIRQRETPLDTMQVRRLNLAGEGSRDYLELRRGLFVGYIGCFAYGRDLYISWTFWVRVSPLRWLVMVIARIWQSITARGTDIYTTLRFDSARAMREAIHSAAREGLDVAVGGLPAQGQGTVGTVVSVVETAS
jgi:hypothetical protein